MQYPMEELEFKLSNGMRLAAHAFGDPKSPTVLLSHGGGQTRHSWGNTAKALANKGWYAVAYDHRGHGDSQWSDDGSYHIDLFAEDQRELAAHFDRPVLVGASLGGISAMIAQGETPDEVFRAVVLVDIVPRMNPEGAMNIVRFMGANMEEGFASLEEAADIIAEYTGRPRRKDVSGLRKNLRQGDDGRYRWHWDPRFVRQRSSSEKLARSDRLVDATRKLTMPLLLIRGQMSDLVTPELAAEFLEIAPHAEYVDVKDAQHMVAGDKNDIFSQAVEDFLDGLS